MIPLDAYVFGLFEAGVVDAGLGVSDGLVVGGGEVFKVFESGEGEVEGVVGVVHGINFNKYKDNYY